MAEITQGLREADAGDFATDEEMADMDALTWEGPAGYSAHGNL